MYSFQRHDNACTFKAVWQQNEKSATPFCLVDPVSKCSAILAYHDRASAPSVFRHFYGSVQKFLKRLAMMHDCEYDIVLYGSSHPRGTNNTVIVSTLTHSFHPSHNTTQPWYIMNNQAPLRAFSAAPSPISSGSRPALHMTECYGRLDSRC